MFTNIDGSSRIARPQPPPLTTPSPEPMAQSDLWPRRHGCGMALQRPPLRPLPHQSSAGSLHSREVTGALAGGVRQRARTDNGEDGEAARATPRPSSVDDRRPHSAGVADAHPDMASQNRARKSISEERRSRSAIAAERPRASGSQDNARRGASIAANVDRDTAVNGAVRSQGTAAPPTQIPKPRSSSQRRPSQDQPACRERSTRGVRAAGQEQRAAGDRAPPAMPSSLKTVARRQGSAERCNVSTLNVPASLGAGVACSSSTAGDALERFVDMHSDGCRGPGIGRDSCVTVV